MKKRIAELQKSRNVVAAKKWWNDLSRGQKIVVISITLGVTVAVATYLLSVGCVTAAATNGSSVIVQVMTPYQAFWLSVITGSATVMASAAILDEVNIDNLSFDLADL